MNSKINLRILFAALGLIIQAGSVIAQGTAFTYQGRLNHGGNPVTGSYDLKFSLFNAAINGTQVGNAVTDPAIGVTNGLFNAQVDFGLSPFNGQALWLQIAVSPAGLNTFTNLSPLQPLTASPYALQALNASAAGAVTGPIALAQLPGSVVTNGASNVNIGGTFTGNGAGLTDVSLQPVSISGSNLQAVANTSYVATNANLTIVTLPTNANVGDTIKISTAGAGGSFIVTNSSATFWSQTSAPDAKWAFLTSSSDGIHLAAVVFGGGIYTSTNGGGNWSLTSATKTNWASIASSSDGTHLAGSVLGGGIYTSADGGTSWVQTSAPNQQWEGVASSSDGTHLVAVAYRGGIYTSTNSGGNWTPTSAPQTNWEAVATSSDGSHLVGAVMHGGIYTSANGGGNWTETSAPQIIWVSVASSVDGSRLVAASPDGAIYLSTNSGGSWAQTSAPLKTWISVASSSDGSHLAAATQAAAGIYISANGGQDWTQTDAPSLVNWEAVASSADGAHLFGVVYNGGIYSTLGTGLTEVAGTSQEFQYIGNGTWLPVVSLFNGITTATNLNGTNCVLTGSASAITSGASVDPSLFLHLYNSSTDGGLDSPDVVGIGFGQNSTRQAIVGGTYGNDYLDFYTGGLLTTPKMRIDYYGNVGFGTGTSALGNPLEMGNGAYCSTAGVWTSVSDRNMKENFHPIDPQAMLARVAALPITEWNYKVEPATVKHVGPMAQDFHSTFGLGDNEKAIGSVDEGGVALAAIQGLNQKLDAKDAEITALKRQNEAMEQKLEALQKLVQTALERP